MRARVLLADDHRLLREAFARLLEPGCDVVGSVGDGRALLAAAKELSPDVVVLDIAMPQLNGLEATRLLKRTMPGVKVVVLTISEDAELAAAAVRAGATSYLLKNSAASELLQAISEAMHGRSYFTPLVAKEMVEALAHPLATVQPTDVTSSRQREVLQLLAEGNSMKKIATILKIKPRTVAFHKYGMMKRLGARSSAELVKMAVDMHVVSN